MGANNGLLVEARQNPLIYTFILMIFIVAILFILLSFVIAAIEKKHSSPEWIEAHKNLPTKRKNVTHIAKYADLNQEEEKLLWDICRGFAVPNIEYSFRDNDILDGVFRQKFLSYSNSNSDEIKKHILFSIRYKLERAREKPSFITSTKALQEKQELFHFTENSRKWIFKITENKKDGFFIEVPPEFLAEDLRPAALSRLNLTFNSKNDVSYGFTVRVIRYEKQKDGVERIFVSHSDGLKPVQRRKAKRKDFSSPCDFAAVKVERDENNKCYYEIKENRYKGVLLDISATGCRMKCKLPIKKGQYIYIDFNLENKVQDHGIGTIVLTTKSPEVEEYIVHVQFSEIELAASNKIYAFIYNYLG